MKKKYFYKLIFWLLILNINGIRSQNNLDLIKRNLITYNQKKQDSILIQYSKDSINFPKIAHLFSISSYKKKDYYLALKYGLIELNYFEKNNFKNKTYTNALYNVGRFYYYNDQFSESITTFFKVIENNADEIKTAKSYCEIGRSYKRKGELYKAISFYNKGINILEKKKVKKSLFIQYINIAGVYEAIETKESLNKNLNILNKAKKLFYHKEVNTKNNTFLLNSGFGNAYLNNENFNFKKSKKHFFKNIENAKDSTSIYVLKNAYINLGSLYIKQKNDSALYFLKESLKLKDKDNSRIADGYRIISTYYIEKKKFNLALNAAQKSINASLKSNYNWGELPSKIDFFKAKDKHNLLKAIKNKIEILISLYKETKETKYLKNAIQTASSIEILIKILFEYVGETKTKFKWIKDASSIYILGANASYLMDDSNSFFNFSEKNKALLLTEEIAKKTNQQNLPKHITHKINSFEKSILSFQEKLKKKKINQNEIRDSIFITKRILEKFNDSLKKLYPKYFKNKINIDQLSLNQIKNSLKSNETIISYMINNDKKESLALGLITTNNKTISFILKDFNSLKEDVTILKKIISKPFKTKKEKYFFEEKSNQLFLKLFPTEEIRELILNKKLVFIPDGFLQNFPFETLMISQKKSTYLIQSSDISYTYSMSFLKSNQKVKRKTTTTFLGYAPVSFKNLKLQDLKNSKSELTGIKESINGKIITNNKATKKHFFKHAGASKIVHLATHANTADNPWIAFYDQKLNLHELYTYRNNAELIVLSACNTSLGKIAKGEGVLSLARGFFYSGAKSVISSLWNVNDKSTSFIMTNFYKNLKSSQPKSLALTNAKRAYLKEHSLSEKSPYYWSSFILIGDSHNIDLYDYNYTFIVTVILVFIGIFIFLKKR